MFIEVPDILHVESCVYIHVSANFNVAMWLTVIALRKFMSSTFLEISGGSDLLSDDDDDDQVMLSVDKRMFT